MTFSVVQFKVELESFRVLLNSKQALGEREIQDFLKSALYLTAYIGTPTMWLSTLILYSA